ncbi:hypothetical protein [Rhizobium grahamii]|uniref:Uncharacterized protein n=1 Tax=Rhizobium grahamii TaxID=1120045 RepID=A0A370KJH1_9HYPH|nr:hypothetical protein [Rhizobium grahamii]RDJ06389.1 hypothetical protein B5K06_22905 [Rhizobium grahamii]
MSLKQDSRDANPDLEQTPGKDTRRNEKRKSALVTVSVLATVFGLGCIYGGILLMAAPGVGATSFDFLNLQFSTQQTGVAAIALGAASIIMIFRKVLKAIVDIGRT